MQARKNFAAGSLFYPFLDSRTIDARRKISDLCVTLKMTKLEPRANIGPQTLNGALEISAKTREIERPRPQPAPTRPAKPRGWLGLSPPLSVHSSRLADRGIRAANANSGKTLKIVARGMEGGREGRKGGRMAMEGRDHQKAKRRKMQKVNGGGAEGGSFCKPPQRRFRLTDCLQGMQTTVVQTMSNRAGAGGSSSLFAITRFTLLSIDRARFGLHQEAKAGTYVSGALKERRRHSSSCLRSLDERVCRKMPPLAKPLLALAVGQYSSPLFATATVWVFSAWV